MTTTPRTQVRQLAAALLAALTLLTGLAVGIQSAPVTADQATDVQIEAGRQGKP